MRVICICPTYGRPTLLENSIACFLAQEYPIRDRHLLILDDAGQYRTQHGHGWTVISIDKRFATMPLKYKQILELCALERDSWDAVCMWDDDDIYLPDHIETHVRGLSLSNHFQWSYPAHIYSLDSPGKIDLQETRGNHWASICVRAELFKKMDMESWYNYQQNDFDHKFMAMCQEVGGDPVRVSLKENPTFMFRWQSTNAPHLQHYIRPGNSAYAEFPMHEARKVTAVLPRFDAETVKMMSLYRSQQLPWE